MGDSGPCICNEALESALEEREEEENTQPWGILRSVERRR